MTVVVDHQNAANLAAALESSLRAVELGERRRHLPERHIELIGHCNSGKRVLKVVAPGYRNLQHPQFLDAAVSPSLDHASSAEAAELGGRTRPGG